MDATEPNSLILTMSHSGSLRYYASRMTLRFDLLQEDWLGREINTADDVLFLQWMAKSSMEEAQRFERY